MYLILDQFRDRDWVGAWHFAAALAAVAAAAGLLFLTLGGASPGGTGSGAQVATPRVPAPRVTVRRVAAGETVTVQGVGFTVVEPRAGWARRALAATTAPGRRLVVVAVDLVGRGRRHFDPALLSYLVRGPGGSLYAPLQSGVVGPNSISETRGLGTGEEAEERLLFSLPNSVRHPVLAIQPSPTRALELRTRLAQ